MPINKYPFNFLECSMKILSFLLLMSFSQIASAKGERAALCEELTVRGLPEKMIGKSKLELAGHDGLTCTIKSPSGQVIADKTALNETRKMQYEECMKETSVSNETIKSMIEFFSACEL